jgi:hypothetical protein
MHRGAKAHQQHVLLQGEKHNFEEAQRGGAGARKVKTARIEKDEACVTTYFASIEDSLPMEGFLREGEGTDAALERHYGIINMQSQ